MQLLKSKKGEPHAFEIANKCRESVAEIFDSLTHLDCFQFDGIGGGAARMVLFSIRCRITRLLLSFS